MLVLIQKKNEFVLVDMKPELYKYLSEKKKQGTFKTDKEIKKIGILDFKLIKKPKYNFGENNFGENKYGNLSEIWWNKNKTKKTTFNTKKDFTKEIFKV